MKQQALISEARCLIDDAQSHEGFGRPDQARGVLVKLRELLNSQPELKSAEDEKLEQTLDTSQG